MIEKFIRPVIFKKKETWMMTVMIYYIKKEDNFRNEVFYLNNT